MAPSSGRSASVATSSRGEHLGAGGDRADLAVDEHGADHIGGPEHEILGVGQRHEHHRRARQHRDVLGLTDDGEVDPAHAHLLTDVEARGLVGDELPALGGRATGNQRRGSQTVDLVTEEHDVHGLTVVEKIRAGHDDRRLRVGPDRVDRLRGCRRQCGERPGDAFRDHPRLGADRVDGLDGFGVELLDEADHDEQQSEHDRREQGHDDEPGLAVDEVAEGKQDQLSAPTSARSPGPYLSAHPPTRSSRQ